jgi:hypothetical protein
LGITWISDHHAGTARRAREREREIMRESYERELRERELRELPER